MVRISPSILACDFSRLGEQAAAMEKAGADMLHLDCMDGHFVPNISFGPPVIASLRSIVKIAFDAHLMLADPAYYIGAFAKAGCDIVTFHVESNSDIANTIAAIKGYGMRAGLSLKPATPPEAVMPYLDELSQVLVMTVEPGFGGQAFIPNMCDKIARIRQEALRRGLTLDIEVDGGIDENTAPLAVKAGADILVAGTSLFSARDYGAAVLSLRNVSQSSKV